jgi:RNase P subunit RPR2
MRFNKWTAMRICKRCYTSFIPNETQRKRHDTSYCTRCSEIMLLNNENNQLIKENIKKKK